MSHKVKSNSELSQKQEDWFDGIIGTLMAHRLSLQQGVARNEVKETYKVMWGSRIEFAAKVKKDSTSEVVKGVIYEFLTTLFQRDPKIEQVAFDFSHDKILAWFNIKADDLETEDAIILSAAQTNATFYEDTGISIESIIVEDIDGIPVPAHFQSVVIKVEEE